VSGVVPFSPTGAFPKLALVSHFQEGVERVLLIEEAPVRKLDRESVIRLHLLTPATQQCADEKTLFEQTHLGPSSTVPTYGSIWYQHATNLPAVLTL
jgi:hypothetical protein